MRQNGTEPHAKAARRAARPDMTLKEAAIVLAVTTVLSIAIGLLPHFN